MKEIENRLHTIADTLFDDMKSGKLELPNLGLLPGRMGIIVFCKHYLIAYPDPVKESVLDTYLESFFDSLTSGIGMFTYCNGLAGILDGLKYLNDEKLLEVDYSDIEAHYKSYLQQFSIANILHRNYDYLHGGLGVVKYFTEDAEFVNRALEALDEAALKDGNKYKWISRLGMEEKYGYNISLSHGSSSIISVLALLTAPGIDRSKRDRLILGACDYILSQEVDHTQYHCYYPSMSLENDPQQAPYSRLAWCYGDLGVATSLWQAGKALHKQQWMDKALEVFTFSAARRSSEASTVRDAGLCHGAASIAMMFHYMYRQTENKLFEQTRDYWIDNALEMATFDDGVAGYKSWRGVNESWENEYGLLEGAAGIGLLLLTITTDDARSDKWMRFFLLN